jgi:type II secretory pathway component PulM
MAVLLTLVLLAAVIAVISAPLLRTRKSAEPETPRHADLSAAREAKYREIRDAELDYKTGKLSQADYDTINAALRAEAVEILDQLEALDASSTTVS